LANTPETLRLVLIDPKRNAFTELKGSPYLYGPRSLVYPPDDSAMDALEALIEEMEQRYRRFSSQAASDLTELHAKTGEVLPRIVCVCDEYADLIADRATKKEVEGAITRLGAKARAAGIHLIIATQRPSVNVITGIIKANLPSRIAFQVASQVDSRTIIDTKGADTLIGRGDMLFSPPGSSRLVRAQGAYVSDEEITSIVEFLKKNGPPQYAQAVQVEIDRDPDAEEEAADAADGDLGDDEELFKQAMDVLKTTRRASTSMLQRRLRIGYNRAARIMEIMEEKGIVGPENGSNPREILADLDKT